MFFRSPFSLKNVQSYNSIREQSLDLPEASVKIFDRRIPYLLKKYVPGRQNAMADFLSRKEEPDEQKEKLPWKWELIFLKQDLKSSTEDKIINQNHKVLPKKKELEEAPQLKDYRPKGLVSNALTAQLQAKDQDLR
uniref:Uncharacterized protein n=1 Tax=Romanomermis culicivorax TaxID=13658 RepID=A0A915JJF0_ROMCU